MQTTKHNNMYSALHPAGCYATIQESLSFIGRFYKVPFPFFVVFKVLSQVFRSTLFCDYTNITIALFRRRIDH